MYMQISNNFKKRKTYSDVRKHKSDTLMKFDQMLDKCAERVLCVAVHVH